MISMLIKLNITLMKFVLLNLSLCFRLSSHRGFITGLDYSPLVVAKSCIRLTSFKCLGVDTDRASTSPTASWKPVYIKVNGTQQFYNYVIQYHNNVQCIWENNPVRIYPAYSFI